MDVEGTTAVSVDEASSDDNIFRKLAEFVLGRLTIAHSTAAVERIFSVVSAVKTKYRNRMFVETLEAILRLNINNLISNCMAMGYLGVSSISQK